MEDKPFVVIFALTITNWLTDAASTMVKQCTYTCAVPETRDTHFVFKENERDSDPPYYSPRWALRSAFLFFVFREETSAMS